MPKGIYERTLKQYPKDVVADIRALYIDQEMTIIEVAAALGISDQKVRRIMLRSDIPARPAVMRHPRKGPDNPAWKGEEASYISMHSRLYRSKGKPQKCSVCGTTDPDLNYDWANLTGDYNNQDDYARMCRSCHRNYDNARGRTA